MKKHITNSYLIIFVLFFYINANAQGIDSSKLSLSYANVVKIVPLNLIDISPNVEVDFERCLSKKICLQFGAAYYLSHFIIKSDDTKGFKLQTEVRKNLQPFYANHYYYAFQASYVTKDYSWLDNLGGKLDSTYYSFIGRVKREKQTFSINFKYGRQVYKKHFVLDYFFGIGAKYKMVKTIFPRDNVGYSGDSLQWWYREDNGNFWTINIVANIKIGYCF